MDPPEQSEYRRVLNPFLSPAAVVQWEPLIADFTRACIDDVIETGRLDFVDDFANVVPAILTMAMLGLPLADWEIYCEPAHMQVYTAPDSPNWDRMLETTFRMVERLAEYVQIRKTEPRPGMITALLNAKVMGEFLPDEGIIGTVTLLIGGGFDTTTSLLAGGARLARARGRRARPPRRRHRLHEHRDRGVPPLLHSRAGWRAHRHAGLRGRRLHLLRGRPHVPVVRDVQPRPVVVPEPRRDRARPVPEPPRRVRARRAPLHRLEPRPPRLQAHAARGAPADARLPHRPRGHGAVRVDRHDQRLQAPPGDLHARRPRGPAARRGDGDVAGEARRRTGAREPPREAI